MQMVFSGWVLLHCIVVLRARLYTQKGLPACKKLTPEEVSDSATGKRDELFYECSRANEEKPGWSLATRGAASLFVGRICDARLVRVSASLHTSNTGP